MVNTPQHGDDPTTSHWAPLLDQRRGQVEVRVNGKAECTLELVTGDDPLPDDISSPGGGLLACTSNGRTMTTLARKATTISTSLGPSLVPTVIDLVGRMEVESRGAARRPLPVIYCCENDHEEVRVATQPSRL